MHETQAPPAKLYVAVRGDLPPGLQTAQAVHAAIGFCLAHPDLVRDWHDASNNIVVVAVRDEEHLLDLADACCWHDWRSASPRKIAYSLFHEPDLEDHPDGWHTAIAIEPGEFSRDLCAKLPLALKESVMA